MSVPGSAATTALQGGPTGSGSSGLQGSADSFGDAICGEPRTEPAAGPTARVELVRGGESSALSPAWQSAVGGTQRWDGSGRPHNVATQRIIIQVLCGTAFQWIGIGSATITTITKQRNNRKHQSTRAHGHGLPWPVWPVQPPRRPRQPAAASRRRLAVWQPPAAVCGRVQSTSGMIHHHHHHTHHHHHAHHNMTMPMTITMTMPTTMTIATAITLDLATAILRGDSASQCARGSCHPPRTVHRTRHQN